MIGDPKYLADLARCELPFFTMVHHPQVQAEAWVRKMEQIHVRASEALKKQWPADSPAVQAIMWDYVFIYAGTEQIADDEAFFRKQARYMLNSVTERIVRFNKICASVNPEWGQIVEGVTLLQKAMLLRLEQLD